MIKKLIGVLLVLVVVGALLPVLLPLLFDTVGDVASMNVTASPAAGAMLQTMWPIVIMVIIIGVAAGLIFFAIKRFGIMR